VTPSARGARREIAIGTLWSALTWVVSMLTGPVLVVALVRRMSRGQFGSLATASSAVGLATAVVTVGLQASLTRFGAVVRAENGWAGLQRLWGDTRRVIGLATAGALVAGAVLLVSAYGIANLHSSEFAILAFLPALVVAPAAAAAGGFLRAAFRPRWVSLAGTVGPLAAAAVIVPEVVRSHPAAWAVALARSGGTVLGAAILLWGVAHWRSVDRPERAAAAGAVDGTPAAGAAEVVVTRGAVVRFGLAMQVSVLFATAVSELSVVVLGASRGVHGPAIFAPTAGIAATVLAVPGLIGGFLLPGVAPAAARGEHREVARLFHWASRWEMAIATPAIAVMVVCPADVLRVLFGSGLVGGSDALRILGVGCAVQFAFGYNGLTFSALAPPALITKVQVANVAVAGLCAAVLIPILGITGAAIAPTAALLFANVVTSTILDVKYHVPPADAAMLATVLVFAVACPGIWEASTHVAPGLVRCVFVAVAAGLASVVAAFVSGGRTERERILGLLSERRQRRSGGGLTHLEASGSHASG
jgi:O-antigen/teichoic acid export membrane protein